MRGMIERIDKALLAHSADRRPPPRGRAVLAELSVSLLSLATAPGRLLLGVIRNGACWSSPRAHRSVDPVVVTTGGMMSTAAAVTAGWPAARHPRSPCLRLGNSPHQTASRGLSARSVDDLTLAINAIAQGLMVVHTSASPARARHAPMHFIARRAVDPGHSQCRLDVGAIGGLGPGAPPAHDFRRRVYGIGQRARPSSCREECRRIWSPVLPSRSFARRLPACSGGLFTKVQRWRCISCRRSRGRAGGRAFSAAAEPISEPSPAWSW